MKRPLAGSKLVVATHNKGKLHEFTALLAPHFKDIVSAGDLGLPEPEEIGTTFADNALLKARAAATASGHMALADDSGLCVLVLGGAPGIYSGRYADGPKGRDFAFAMKRLNDEIGTNPNRSAYFLCSLVLAWPEGHTEIFEDRLNGTIIWPPRGSNGHGYDSFFAPYGETRTYAEMTDAEKNAISHRARAVKKLITWLQQKP